MCVDILVDFSLVFLVSAFFDLADYCGVCFYCCFRAYSLFVVVPKFFASFVYLSEVSVGFFFHFSDFVGRGVVGVGV